MGFDLSLLVWLAAIVLLLTLIMRWVFAPSSRPHTGRPQNGPSADLGLLVAVLRRTSRGNALRIKDYLSGQGIRCSMSRLDRDSYDVLVFGRDESRARALLDDYASE